MKRLIHRFAIWLENRALDLQDWSEPDYEPIEYKDLVIKTLKMKEGVLDNALTRHLERKGK